MSNYFTLLTMAAFVSAEEVISKKKPMEFSSDDILVRPFTLYDFQMEITLVCVFLLYTFIWYQGKNANMKKAKYWLAKHFEYLQTQFALVGNEKSALVKDGPADYLLYVSGRRHVQFGHWWFKLKPRNDILTLFTTQILSFTGLVKPAVDRVTLKLVLDKALPEKFVFAVIKNSESAELVKRRYDLSRFAKLGSNSSIPSTHTIHTESQKLADTILTGRVGELISLASDRLESLVISSLPTEEPNAYEQDGSLIMSLSFLMYNDALDPLVELACEIPDIISSLRLSADVKNQINKNREILRKECAKRVAADRAEELARKKAKAKLAEEERVKKMNPTEQRKWEEKERVRQLKKQQKKRGIK